VSNGAAGISAAAGARPGAGGRRGSLTGFLVLLRRHGGFGATVSGAPRTSLGLRPGERAVWTGRARAGWALPLGVLLAAAGLLAGALAAHWVPAVPLIAAGVVMLCFTSVRVRVAARGVTVAYGVLGLRLTRIPLQRISGAEAVRRTTPSFGYRGSLLVSGSAAVVRAAGPRCG
jgi:hypothetical protein